MPSVCQCIQQFCSPGYVWVCTAVARLHCANKKVLLAYLCPAQMRTARRIARLYRPEEMPSSFELFSLVEYATYSSVWFFSSSRRRTRRVCAGAAARCQPACIFWVVRAYALQPELTSE